MDKPCQIHTDTLVKVDRAYDIAQTDHPGMSQEMVGEIKHILNYDIYIYIYIYIHAYSKVMPSLYFSRKYNKYREHKWYKLSKFLRQSLMITIKMKLIVRKPLMIKNKWYS